MLKSGGYIIGGRNPKIYLIVSMCVCVSVYMLALYVYMYVCI